MKNSFNKRLSAPEGVPRPSPILVLAGPYHTFLRRSDGIRGFHDSMADNEVNSIHSYHDMASNEHNNICMSLAYNQTDRHPQGIWLPLQYSWGPHPADGRPAQRPALAGRAAS